MISDEQIKLLLKETWDYVDVSFPNEVDKMQVTVWLNMFLFLIREPYFAHMIEEGVFLFPNEFQVENKNFIEALRISANLLEKMGGHKEIKPS